MDASDVCPTEEAIKAFLEYLVDPILPPRSSLRDIPSLSQQESVAKQVHAVVLLYNYYHRKQCPDLEVLNFDSFCKLVLVLKPALLPHMKFMQKPSDTELDDLEKQLSVTEKTIMDACNMSLRLDASKDVPNIEGWPISKVTVFLVDPKKENCLLLFSLITQGVWSVIEKDLDVAVHSSEDQTEAKHVNRNKRVTGKPSRVESRTDGASFRKLAYSAVSEAAGINQTDLLVLESHVVFSVSKEKAAVCFFIIQCTKTVSEEIIQIPIQDVIGSLQGPLVGKSSSSWTVTPVVEYFHVLPYAGILLDWFSRRESSNGLQDSRLDEENITVNSPDRVETPCKLELDKSRDKSHEKGIMIENVENTSGSNPQSWKQKDTSGCCKTSLADAFNGPQKMEVDDSSTVPLQNEQSCKNISSTIQVVKYHVENLEKDTPRSEPQSREKKDTTGCCKTSLADAFSGPQKIEVKVVNSKTRPFITDCGAKKIVAGKICSIDLSDQDGIDDSAIVTYQSSSEDLYKLQIAIASKENILSQTALKVLMKRRDDLSLQQRNIEDEIAQCDKKIQTILNGGEDDLALKVESIIEGCNDVCVRSGRTHRLLEDQLPQSSKRKRLSEAILKEQNPCQDLDDACYENNWVLPTYRVSPSDGGFQAEVTVNGMDFDCSSGGDLCSNPREARESAAAQILVKLRSMAGQAQQF
ncbi:hypothetical protein PRUPE_1G191700 [Prunus persica]|uniref:DRBM domain-containing protein n=1 Tax=Prunus persica TaxID=3760 RepID=A0A251QZY6_PRUPE|nr:uncharacterized protein LOC18789194 [Prunus persica]ONI29293.1 hypothetical protein PRUPE_1G191700 [Prunus persica]